MQSDDVQRDFNTAVIEEFRANNGIVGGVFSNEPLLLLRTVGARTRKLRTNPLSYLEDKGRLIVIASYAGNRRNPPWYYNLLANPRVTVEVGVETFTGHATIVEEPERSELFEKIATRTPLFRQYASRTSRVIPVVAIERV